MDEFLMLKENNELVQNVNENKCENQTSAQNANEDSQSKFDAEQLHCSTNVNAEVHEKSREELYNQLETKIAQYSENPLIREYIDRIADIFKPLKIKNKSCTIEKLQIANKLLDDKVRGLSCKIFVFNGMKHIYDGTEWILTRFDDDFKGVSEVLQNDEENQQALELVSEEIIKSAPKISKIVSNPYNSLGMNISKIIIQHKQNKQEKRADASKPSLLSLKD